VNCLIHADRNEFAIFTHQRRLDAVFSLVAKELSFADGAAILNFDDFIVFNSYFDVVA
jgi:hypothetical protein